ENILITGDDFAYLVDFGIARAASDPGLTQTGTAMGTYRYMAPERFTADEVTYRADIYSLACVLTECLTGAPPFRAESMERLVGAHLTEPAPRLSQLLPGRIPVAMDQVIARGMAKNPEDRYRSAGEMAAAAHDALTAPEQHQAATILRHGEEATLRAAAIDTGAHTSWRQPVWSPPPGAGGGWPGQPGPPPVRGPAGPPDFSKPFEPDRKRKRPILIGAAVLVALAVIAAVGYLVLRPSGPSTSASGQSVLPFNGIDFRLSPGAVQLDADGNVYVASEGMYGRVVKLPAGSDTPAVQPFNGLYQPQGLAVDSAGTMYVSDFNNRVVKLTAGSNDQTDLPISGLNYPEGVAVDTAGNVYVADRGNDRVVKLAAGSNAQNDLPFEGLSNPDGVAVDTDGNVYVTDTDNNRVLKLAGSGTQEVLPFTGVSVPWGIAVDSAGAVYVTEHNKNAVVKLPAGASASTVLPFEGLNTPLDVAVGKDGTVYVADRGNDRVVKLAPS
ncbi:MAG: serine/threonine-protein kinase PknD, partial [Mycobacterium sp.]